MLISEYLLASLFGLCGIINLNNALDREIGIKAILNPFYNPRLKNTMNIFKTWTFQWWEVGLIKLCLISLGIILGIYFYGYLMGLMWLWWILFVVIAVYFIAMWLKDGMK